MVTHYQLDKTAVTAAVSEFAEVIKHFRKAA